MCTEGSYYTEVKDDTDNSLEVDLYRSIVENAVIGIFQSTPQGKYLHVNPALIQLYGYDSREELIENLNDIENQLYLDPNRRKEFLETIELRDIVADFESDVRRKDGSILSIRECARVVRGPSGEALFFEGFVEPVRRRVN